MQSWRHSACVIRIFFTIIHIEFYTIYYLVFSVCEWLISDLSLIVLIESIIIWILLSSSINVTDNII